MRGAEEIAEFMMHRGGKNRAPRKNPSGTGIWENGNVRGDNGEKSAESPFSILWKRLAMHTGDPWARKVFRVFP